MKIAAYCRVSTEKDEQLDSLNHQKRFFSEYAEKHGHILVGLYADEGISGTSLRKREEFQHLMRDARMGLFDAVVVKDISRFARNTVDFLQSIRELKALGINTKFITANMESLGESEFVLTIFSAMAQEESANLSKRVKFGKRINAEKGRVPQRIFGYDRVDNFTLNINREEAETIKEIYRLYLDEGLGCRTISAALNQENRKTKLQCAWNAKGVRRVLTNPIYCGHYVNHKYEIEDYLTGRQVPIPPAENFHHDRPEWAIVSPERFRQVQEQLNARRKQYHCGETNQGTRYSAKHLFSTLIRCEQCGRSFCRKQYTYTHTRTYWKCITNDQYTAQHCDNHVTVEEDDLIAELKNGLTAMIQNKDAFTAQILAEVKQRQPEKYSAADLQNVEKRRKELLYKKRKYQEMYAADIITMTELKDKIGSITDEMCALDEEENRCRRLQEAKKKDGQLDKWYMEEIERFLSLESAANVDLRKIIDHIGVDQNGNVGIYLKKIHDDVV